MNWILAAVTGTCVGILVASLLPKKDPVPPPLRPCTITIDLGIKIAGALHEQSNGKFCIPYADEIK
jgi:hypothetical protein